ncbi:hypothetical protein ABFS83_04G053500 [Erythranthe nasuta]
MASVRCFLFLLLTISLSPLRTLSQTAGNITVGASLSATEASDPWRSPSGDFAFGFQQLQDDKDLFLLSIWFDKIPDKTVVWFSNRNASNPVPRGSTVHLTAADGLVVRDPQGRLMFSPNGGVADEVGYGYLNDTGNLVLRRRRSDNSEPLWESFKNPSDTILPTQIIGIDTALVSKKSEGNFSEGRFSARMKGGGDFVFNAKSVPTNTDYDDEYYNSGTSDQNASASGFQVVFDERASIYILRRNGGQVVLSPRWVPSPADFYHRATIDFDGVFTQYYHPRTSGGAGNQGWTAASSWPENICFTRSRPCGYNSVCRLENQRPVCQCPLGFSLSDPNNPYGDCRPNSAQSCVQSGDKEDDYDVSEISDTDWPFNDYQQIKPSTADQCKNACLNDCFCGVSIYRSDTCWKKTLPLSNGRVDVTLGVTAFLKFRKTDLINPNPNPITPVKNRNTLIVVGSALLGSSVFVNLLFITLACLGFFLIYKKKNPISDHMNSGANLRCFTYKELVQATNGFEQEVGRGAFGIVYKGLITNSSKTLVAVKKLDRVVQDSEKEFRAEVNAISQTHHKNLVRLIGFCDEGAHRMLVYEYMSNGTLSGFLFGTSTKPGWSQRSQIAVGVARGLTYLHEECVTQIIHCDIKPQNILLDEYYNARICDFGLAKLLAMDQSKTTTNIRGTKGYVAPEWFRNQQITAKVDVYSFGVLLLEIVSFRKSVDVEEGENPILTDWAWDCFAEGRIDRLVDNNDDDVEALSDGRKVERFVMVGLWCVQEDANLRPTMRKACQMLEGEVEVERPPNPYPFTSTYAPEQ